MLRDLCFSCHKRCWYRHRRDGGVDGDGIGGKHGHNSSFYVLVLVVMVMLTRKSILEICQTRVKENKLDGVEDAGGL